MEHNFFLETNDGILNPDNSDGYFSLWSLSPQLMPVVPHCEKTINQKQLFNELSRENDGFTDA